MFEFVVILLTIGCVLGAAVPQLDGRIVGGEATSIESFPCQVSIQVDGNHFCGGAVISPYYILTAGHCIFSYFSIDRYTVRVGSTYFNTGGSVHKVDYAHENFKLFTLENDIAIIKLATPVQINNSVKPISLPTANLANGVQAAVSGWGSTSEEESSLPEQLRYVLVNIISKKSCQYDYGYVSDVKDGMICAMAEGKDACQGDSGGPLESNGELVGIVSWGRGCAQSRYPGVYTNVAKFLDWLKPIIEK